MENRHADFDKIGVNTLKCLLHNGMWKFEYKNHHYQLAPAGMTDFSLSPMIVGADRLLVTGCKLKKIPNPENGFWLLFSQEYFPNPDVRFDFKENKFNGWVYTVQEMNLKNLMEGQCAWLCPYLKFYFPEPPATLYLKIEALEA